MLVLWETNNTIVSNETVARNLASYHFKEISSGVYYVEKDRFDTFDTQYVTSTEVARAMETPLQPTSIKRIDGALIVNRAMEIKLGW